MSFNDVQTRLLKAKLKRRHVKTRDANGETLSYVEGWHAIAEANRIFGFEYWDRQTLTPHCHWTVQQSGQAVCFYSTKVRISVRAGEAVIVREGLGTGMGRSPQPELAHDMAIKSAETDATKRALATFGNAFGLALYDPQQSQVTRSRTPDGRKGVTAEFVVTGLDEKVKKFQNPEAFTREVLRLIDEVKAIDDLYAFWVLNAASLKSLDSDTRELAQRIIESLKARARQIAKETVGATVSGQPLAISDQRTANSYLLPKEKRIRDRAHLEFVATQPCLICGRKPTQAHHLRFAQPRAMALKVSDEFTVPLCTIHHDQLHRTSDEPAFWARNGVPEPLKHAAKLWKLSHQRGTTEGRDAGPEVGRTWDPDTEQEFNEPSLSKPCPTKR
jgi:Rad52/22 family double-strand break repair protein